MQGIYKIVNTMNGDCYVGSSNKIEVRKRSHRFYLRAGTHYNPRLQKSWAEYGEAAFIFEILEEVIDFDQLLLREQYYLDTLHPQYNIATYASRPLTVYVKTPEHIEKIKAANRNPANWTPERKRRLSEANRGRKHTLTPKERLRRQNNLKRPEVREAARLSNATRPHSKEESAKKSASLKVYYSKNPGHSKGTVRGPRSEETKAKISAANKGRKQNLSPERREQLRSALTPEARRNAAIANSNRVYTEEQKAARSASMKAVWAARKAASSP